MPGSIPQSKQPGDRSGASGTSATPGAVFIQLFRTPLDRASSNPLFAQIAERLRTGIETGKLLPGSRLPSEVAMCRILNVSRNTVMRAINDLREEGLLFREQGSGTYVRREPSVNAGKSLRLGIVSPTSRLTMSDLYLGGILDGISQALPNINAVAVLGSQSINPSSGYFNEITRRDIDGFIVIAPGPQDRGAITVLERNGVPFVLVGAHLDAEWDCVTTDNRHGVYLAMQHLWKQGHKRIGCIAAPDYDYDSGERWAGFKDAWELFVGTASKPFMHRLTGSTTWEEQIATIWHEWLDSEVRPTALLAAGFPISLACIRTLNASGTQIGGEVSLVGFDDYPMLEYVAPPLTAIRQPLADMGETAASLLAAKIRGELRVPVHHKLPVELIVRNSTSPPASN